ncbi:MAG: hypothetical protein C0601_11360 [Candidatus Muiribacterium halophilum]|uniref:Uncharacterized protein n=1 Tax=Muiribacterium halophilum TaxID=2053465 RepID=A0A2N5ZC11_MUIH1|nr:MAG: hypothetical protein C0601_11360 [Candidatus Muirbacterium halophilum]
MKDNKNLLFYKIDFSKFSSRELDDLIKWSVYFKIDIYFYQCENYLSGDEENIPSEINLLDPSEIVSFIEKNSIILIQTGYSDLEEKADVIFSYTGDGISKTNNAFLFSHLSKIRETLENLFFYKKISD